MALHSRKTRVESRSSIRVNRFVSVPVRNLNFVSSDLVAINISLNRVYSKSIEILCLELENVKNLWKSLF